MKYPYIVLSSNQFASWLYESSWWLALSVAGLLALSIALILILGRNKGKKSRKPIASKETYFSAFGGEDNILGRELKGSRIVVKLKDANLVDQEKIKEAGVDGFILMSTQLTLVIKGDAKKVYETLFGE